MRKTNFVDQHGTIAVHSKRVAATTSVRLIESAEAWSALLMQTPYPHLPQSWAYGEGKAVGGWQPKRAIICRKDTPLAIATVLERRVLGLRIAARVNRGPLFFAPDPADSDIVAVFSALRHHWRGPLLIAPALLDTESSAVLLREAGFRKRKDWGWTTGRIDLRRSEDEIWRGFTSTFRNRARQAEKHGAETRIASDAASYEWMVERHLLNMKAKGFRAADAGLLRALRAAAPSDVTVFQLIDNDIPVAGMSVIQFGAVAEYHVGWFGPEGRRLNAGNALMWAIIREMKRRGIKSFDVGGMREGDGYTRFKRTLRPEEFTLAGEWVSF